MTNSAPWPMSPCICICRIGDDGLCLGCQRTLAEITGWPRMTPEEQWAVLRALDERRPSKEA